MPGARIRPVFGSELGGILESVIMCVYDSFESPVLRLIEVHFRVRPLVDLMYSDYIFLPPVTAPSRWDVDVAVRRLYYTTVSLNNPLFFFFFLSPSPHRSVGAGKEATNVLVWGWPRRLLPSDIATVPLASLIMVHQTLYFFFSFSLRSTPYSVLQKLLTVPAISDRPDSVTSAESRNPDRRQLNVEYRAFPATYIGDNETMPMELQSMDFLP